MAGGGRGGESCLSLSQRAVAGTRAGPARPRGGNKRQDPGPRARRCRPPLSWARVESAHVVGKFRDGKSGWASRGWGRGERAGLPLLLAQAKRKKRREAGVGVGGAGSTDLNRFRLPPPPAPGSRSGEARTASSRKARARLPPPPYFFFANPISTRAHIRRLCGFFSPLGKKTRRVKEERAKRRTPPRRCLHSVLLPGAGTPPPPARSLPALRRVPLGERARAPASEDAARLFGARAHIAAAAAGRRSRGEKGLASPSPSSHGTPRPAGPCRQAEGGREQRGGGRSRGPGEAHSGRPARRWMRRPGSLETTLPCDAPGRPQGPRPGAPRRL